MVVVVYNYLFQRWGAFPMGGMAGQLQCGALALDGVKCVYSNPRGPVQGIYQ